eukprot:85501-Pelagomonas_calceolata.AAC.3
MSKLHAARLLPPPSFSLSSMSSSDDAHSLGGSGTSNSSNSSGGGGSSSNTLTVGGLVCGLAALLSTHWDGLREQVRNWARSCGGGLEGGARGGGKGPLLAFLRIPVQLPFLLAELATCHFLAAGPLTVLGWPQQRGGRSGDKQLPVWEYRARLWQLLAGGCRARLGV